MAASVCIAKKYIFTTDHIKFKLTFSWLNGGDNSNSNTHEQTSSDTILNLNYAILRLNSLFIISIAGYDLK